jgi:uncharacterized membrane protein YfcA
MDVPTGSILVAAGIAGGTISALVGGAAVVTFPTLIATGLSPAVATATSLLALVPCNFLAAAYDRAQWPASDRSLIALVLSSLLGAGVGAILLTITPERMFAACVPALLGFATLLFAYGGRISEWIGKRGAAGQGDMKERRSAGSIALMTLVSIYGGYFGGGVGVLVLGVLSIETRGDYRAANVMKNLVVGLNGVVASAIFIVQGVIVWPAALLMMAGALIGGLIGARLIQVMRRQMMRAIVVSAGALLTAVFAWRYWF